MIKDMTFVRFCNRFLSGIYQSIGQSITVVVGALEYELQRVQDETSFPLNELIFSEQLFR